MNRVFALKEVNILDSGESGFHVELYETAELAKKNMKEQAQSHIEEYDAEITWEDETSIRLDDPDGNTYEFDIEVLGIYKEEK